MPGFINPGKLFKGPIINGAPVLLEAGQCCQGGLALGACPGSNSGMACVDCLPDHYQDGSENARSGVG